VVVSDIVISSSTMAGNNGSQRLEINMVFQLPQEFRLPEPEMAELTLGLERAIFDKLETLGQHMKLLYVRGHLDGVTMNQMLVVGGACVNIMPGSEFKKLGHKDEELLRKNMRLRDFSVKASDTRGIISKELMVGSKTVPTVFFMVNVTGRYNIPLGRDWIHANGCIPSTLHQCVIQWIGDQVEVVGIDNSACVMMAET
jgi:hypothetical protein